MGCSFEVVKFIFLTFLIATTTAKEPLCNHILCTSTLKTLIRFSSSSALLRNNSIDVIQNDIWQEAKSTFNDYKSISFAEIDCDEKPEACYNFPNEKIPSYVLLHEDLVTAVCVQPENFRELNAFCMEMLGSKYQRKKDFFVYDAECKTIYPEIKGTRLSVETFESHVKCGHHFVLFYQPKCTHCKKIIARWNKLTVTFKELDFAFMKCENESERAFCATQQAIGFPTLNFYTDGMILDEYTGADDSQEFQNFINECVKTISMCKETSNDGNIQETYELLLN